MNQSIVNIQSNRNSAFGTGFVIYKDDKKGSYILTCTHVLEEVETPIIEGEIAKVVAKGQFIDLAVLYIKGLETTELPLEILHCIEEDVEIIGFSHFNHESNQKLHIKAKLYEESIELHSLENKDHYSVKKIEAKEGFHFDKGNSGSPVLCKNTGNVIAVISKKDRNNIAYAIDIEHLKRVWEKAPEEIFQIRKKRKRSFLYYFILIPSLIIGLYFSMTVLLLAMIKFFKMMA